MSDAGDLSGQLMQRRSCRASPVDNGPSSIAAVNRCQPLSDTVGCCQMPSRAVSYCHAPSAGPKRVIPSNVTYKATGRKDAMMMIVNLMMMIVNLMMMIVNPRHDSDPRNYSHIRFYLSLLCFVLGPGELLADIL